MSSVANAGETTPAWQELVPGVWRSPGTPCGYALVEEDAALLIGAAEDADPAGLQRSGVRRLEGALLTHAHRDSCQRVGELLAAKTPVRAARDAAPWLTAAGVRQFWQNAMPRGATGAEPPLRERTFNEWVYLVLPVGHEEIACDLHDGQTIDWGGWQITVLATPGHSREHLSFLATRRATANAPDQAPRVLFAGDALCGPGKLWSPYTTDWDHWTGRGLQAAAESLRKLAATNPTLVCPEHGPCLAERPLLALQETALNAAEAAWLKSFERFSREGLGSPPATPYLARSQVITAGDEPWSQLSPHLYLTGNTFALKSAAGPLLLIDAYGPNIAAQVETLRRTTESGPVEVALITHAHNDHYKGLYLLPNRDRVQVWTQERVAAAVTAPYRYLAPYLDARPLRVDRQLRDQEEATWREYTLRFHHLPGQTTFHLGVELTVDGQRCFVTGDNFFAIDQFSGSGGWSGRNRGLPDGYAASARKILQARPDWILAEHGGAFWFDAEDFSRRVTWARRAAAAADAISPSGDHRLDWNPQRVRVEPLLQAGRAGQVVEYALVIERAAGQPDDAAGDWSITVDGRGLIADLSVPAVALEAQETDRRGALTIQILPDCPAGRHVFPLTVRHRGRVEPSDTFLVIDVP